MRFIANFALTFAVAGLLRWLDYSLWLAVAAGVVAGVGVPMAFDRWMQSRRRK